VKARQREPVPSVVETDWPGDATRAATEDVRQLLRAERRRRRSRWFAGGLIVLAVGAVATLLLRTTFFEPAGGDANRDDHTAPAASTDGAPFDAAAPFASTPAATWPDGAAGIVPPSPEAVGGFSAQKVGEATQRVRDVLVASRLDPRMIVSHDPGGYLDLLAPDARRQLEPLFGGGQEPRVQSLVSLLAPGTKLLPVAPKVSGSMTVAPGEAGELVVHTNYVFAYAFEPKSPLRLADAMNTIVVVRADVDYVMRAGSRWTEGSRGLWFDHATGFGYSIGCDAYRKGFLAPVATERSVAGGPDKGDPRDYFNPASPLPPAGGCRH
jgi:hypothetical protein